MFPMAEALTFGRGSVPSYDSEKLTVIPTGAFSDDSEKAPVDLFFLVKLSGDVKSWRDNDQPLKERTPLRLSKKRASAPGPTWEPVTGSYSTVRISFGG